MKPRLPYKFDNAKAHHTDMYPGSRVDGSNRFPNIWRCQVAAWQCRDLTLLRVLECPSCEHRLAINSPVPELALVNATRFPVVKKTTSDIPSQVAMHIVVQKLRPYNKRWSQRTFIVPLNSDRLHEGDLDSALSYLADTRDSHLCVNHHMSRVYEGPRTG